MTVGEGTAIRRRRTSKVRAVLRNHGLAGTAKVKADPTKTDQTLIIGLGDSEAVREFLAELKTFVDNVDKVSKIDTLVTTALAAITVEWQPASQGISAGGTGENGTTLHSPAH